MVLLRKRLIFIILSFFLGFISILFFIRNNIFWFLIFFEITIFPIFILVTGWGYQLERVQARYYLLLYTTFFSIPFFLCLLKFGDEIKINFLSNQTLMFSAFFLSCSILIFLVKAPIYLFHLWLPKAHVESPVIGSIFLAGLLLKFGGFGVIRLFIIIKINIRRFLYFILYLTLFGRLVSILICLFQRDQKSIIAYARVSHIRLIIASVLSLFILRLKIRILLIFVHAIVSPIIFFISYLFYTQSLNRFLTQNQGFFRKRIFFRVIIILIILINFSIPPFPSFFREIFLFERILSKRVYLLIFVAAFVFVGCAYSVYLLVNSVHGKFLIEKNLLVTPRFMVFIIPLFVFLGFIFLVLHSIF